MSGTICENPSCRKVGRLQCSRCKFTCYCSVECQRALWPFHKSLCKFSLADCPLAPLAPLVPESLPHPQVQLWTLLDALDRAVRVTPAEKEVDDAERPGQKRVLKSKLRRLVSHEVHDDAVNGGTRALLCEIGDSDVVPTTGSDLYEQLRGTGFPVHLALRLTLQRCSMRFCLALILVLETLGSQTSCIVMHGRERIGNYFIAEGRALTAQPRLQMAVGGATATSVQTEQPLLSINNHYALLFTTTHVFDENATANYGAFEARELAAQSIDCDLAFERHSLRRLMAAPAAPAAAAPAPPAADVTTTKSNPPAPQEDDRPRMHARAEAMCDSCVFMAPAAGEYDARLHSSRLQKGIPEWFHVEQVYTESGMATLECSEQLSTQAMQFAELVLQALFGSRRGYALFKAHRESSAAAAATKPSNAV